MVLIGHYMVGLSGLEPPTPTLSGWCSNRLSYNPLNFFGLETEYASSPFYFVVEVSGIEPLTPCLQGRCSTS